MMHKLRHQERTIHESYQIILRYRSLLWYFTIRVIIYWHVYHILIWNNINQVKSNQFQWIYHNQRALSSTKSKETAAKTVEIARSSSRGKRRYESDIVTSNDSIHNSLMEVETCYHSFLFSRLKRFGAIRWGGHQKENGGNQWNVWCIRYDIPSETM